MPLPVDPRNGQVIIIGYYANVPAAIVGLVVFGLLCAGFAFQWYRARAKYMLWIVIGTLMMALGFAVRIPMHSNPTSIPIYTVQTLLILLSPCAFIAQDYYVLPHLAESIGAHDCLLLRARLIGRIFLTSDCITFVVQLAGSAMAASASLAKTGETIALVGLIVQLISFGLFMVLWVYFGYNVHRKHPKEWAHGGALQPVGRLHDWRSVYWAIGWTTIGILIRCIYRVIEFAQGYDGYLRTTEWCFYVLDTLPLFAAILVWLYVWPPSVLSNTTAPEMPLHVRNDPTKYTSL